MLIWSLLFYFNILIIWALYLQIYTHGSFVGRY